MTDDSTGFRAGLAQKAIDPVVRAVREELASARREIGDRVSGARNGVVLAAVGAVLALVTAGLLAALAVALLALALPLWSAVAITLVVFAVAAAILLATGLRGIGRGVPPLPVDTVAEVRERVGGPRH
ncbi:phage holin family protein [Rathayibacter caricis]|jgi:fatty acid desaturase|uniref:phage holin family protein n=1 Tax=Rathayibacter caricis TaxID=110936 RepID=UPI001FB38C6F|nr:phage holin family protein [Rathayibacter caricis]MCJ1697205.1 phage holin family protein [Rathayibacter caricis]